MITMNLVSLFTYVKIPFELKIWGVDIYVKIAMGYNP